MCSLRDSLNELNAYTRYLLFSDVRFITVSCFDVSVRYRAFIYTKTYALQLWRNFAVCKTGPNTYLRVSVLGTVSLYAVNLKFWSPVGSRFHKNLQSLRIRNKQSLRIGYLSLRKAITIIPCMTNYSVKNAHVADPIIEYPAAHTSKKRSTRTCHLLT